MSKKVVKSPKLAAKLMYIFLPDDIRNTAPGDFEEEYFDIVEESGRLNAWLWYWIQVIKSVFLCIGNLILENFIMLKNYLKTMLRNLKRYKGYSFINIFGFASGLAITFILAFYVIDDIKYDRFHKNADNIYRIYSLTAESLTAATSGPLVLKVKEEIPEILSSTRMWRYRSVNVSPGDGKDAANNETSISGNAVLTDPGFFEIFSFEILSGESADVLSEPGRVFITNEFADALFGGENPVGRSLQISRIGNVIVAGIVKKPPKNSHIQFDIIAPLLVERNPVWWGSWQNNGLFGYALLAENADLKEVERKMNLIARNNNYWEVCVPKLQPMLNIHLESSDFNYDFINFGKNDRIIVISLASVGLFVLVIACINFINLSAARASKRACEVGIRKVVGSNKRLLFFQFISESVIVTILSFFIAIVMLIAISPKLNSILNKQLDLNVFENPYILITMFLMSVLFGVFSGIYPAAIISSFKPVKVLKGELTTGKTGIILRRILIIFQFAITISLVFAVLTVYYQINYMDSVNLGYNRDNVIVIPSGLSKGEDVFKNKLSQLSGISELGRMSVLPSPSILRSQIEPEGLNKSRKYVAAQVGIDETIFETLSIKIVEGRGFSKEFTADNTQNIIVNETLVRIAGWEEPIGKRLGVENMNTGKMDPMRVIGVTKDFHFFSPRQAIEPMIFMLSPENSRLLFARISDRENKEVLSTIENIYKEIFPGSRYNPVFFDDYYDNQFNGDRDFASNIGIFCVIAIYIACLGLIGLVSHTTDQRRKEIVVRKILGCRTGKINGLLVSDFLKWILLANLFAWPMGYFAMNKWLNEFTYKMPFSILPFVLSGTGVALVAILTISFQTYKAANVNPVDSLKYE